MTKKADPEAVSALDGAILPTHPSWDSTREDALNVLYERNDAHDNGVPKRLARDLPEQGEFQSVAILLTYYDNEGWAVEYLVPTTNGTRREAHSEYTKAELTLSEAVEYLRSLLD